MRLSKIKNISIKINTTNSNIFNKNYGVLIFPLHEGIRRHAVSKPCQTQNNNKQTPFLIQDLEISDYTHTNTFRTKWVPSSTMDVRGANTFLLHNWLPIPCFWSRRPPYPHLWGFIYIFPFLLEQIKLGGDFTISRFKWFLKIELLQLATSLGTFSQASQP